MMIHFAICLLFVKLLSSRSISSALPSYRPGFHISQSTGWMGDPFPVMNEDLAELYHLFSECSSHISPSTGPTVSSADSGEWCHLISDDLVHWKWPSSQSLPPGSQPGSVLSLSDNVNYTGAAVYHCNGSICLDLTNSSTLEDWTPYNNPIIKPVPQNSQTSILTSPRLFQDSNGTFCILAVSKSLNDSNILLFTSKDMLIWTFSNLFWTSGKLPIRTFDYFPLSNGAIHSLIVSYQTPPESHWYTGTVNRTGQFVVQHGGIVDYGAVYSSGTFEDATGRRILIGSINETRNLSWVQSDGWDGVEGIPRKIVLNSDGSLSFPPIEEIALLQTTVLVNDSIRLQNDTYIIGGMAGEQTRIIMSVDFGQMPDSTSHDYAVGINVRCNPRRTECTKIQIEKSGPVTCNSSDMMTGTDLAGQDYFHFKMSLADPRVCQEACCNDSNCVAWTYANPQPMIDGGGIIVAGDCIAGDICCWLKNKVPQGSPRPNVTSGVVESEMKLGLFTSNSSLSPLAKKADYVVPLTSRVQTKSGERRALDPAQCMAVSIMYNTDTPGGDYKTVNLSMADPAFCKQLCCKDPQCHGWTMAYPNPAATATCSLNGICCYLKDQPGSPRPNSACASGSSRSFSSSIHATLEIFIDHSVIEVFADDGDTVITGRVYPTCTNSTEVELFATNAVASFQLTAWEMAEAYFP